MAAEQEMTIDAALKAATEQVCRYGDGLKCDPEPDCDFCRSHAAKVVAAFLRGMGGMQGGAGWVAGPNLAKLVEEIAPR